MYDFYDLDTKGALLQKSEAAILEIVASTEATGHIDFLRSKLQSLQQALILPRQPDQPTTSELDQDPIYIIGQYLIDDDNFGYRGAELLEQISKISKELFKGLIKEKDELAQIRKKISSLEEFRTAYDDWAAEEQQGRSSSPVSKSRKTSKLSTKPIAETEKQLKELTEELSSLRILKAANIQELGQLGLEYQVNSIIHSRQENKDNHTQLLAAARRKIAKLATKLTELNHQIDQGTAKLAAKTQIQNRDDILDEELRSIKRELEDAQSQKSGIEQEISSQQRSAQDSQKTIAVEEKWLEIFERAKKDVKKSVKQKSQKLSKKENPIDNLADDDQKIYQELYIKIKEAYRYSTSTECRHKKQELQKNIDKHSKRLDLLSKQIFELSLEKGLHDIKTAEDDFAKIGKLIQVYSEINEQFGMLKVLESLKLTNVSGISEIDRDTLKSLQSKVEEVIKNLTYTADIVTPGYEAQVLSSIKSLEEVLSSYKSLQDSKVKSTALKIRIQSQVEKVLKLEEAYQTKQKELITAFSNIIHGKVFTATGTIDLNAIKLLFELIGKIPNHDMLNLIQFITHTNPGLDLTSVCDHNNATLLHKFVTTGSIDFEVIKFFADKYPPLLTAQDKYGDSFMRNLADFLIQYAPSSYADYIAHPEVYTKYDQYKQVAKEFALDSITKYYHYKDKCKELLQTRDLAIESGAVNVPDITPADLPQDARPLLHVNQDFFLYLFEHTGSKLPDLVNLLFDVAGIKEEDVKVFRHEDGKYIKGFIKLSPYTYEANKNGDSLLHLLASNASLWFDYYENNHQMALDSFTEAFVKLVGILPNGYAELKNANGYTAAHILAQQYMPDVLTAIYSSVPNISMLTDDNKTVLYHLLESDNLGSLWETNVYNKILLIGDLKPAEVQNFLIKATSSNKSTIDLAIEKGICVRELSHALLTGFYSAECSHAEDWGNYLEWIWYKLRSLEPNDATLLKSIATICSDENIRDLSPTLFLTKFAYVNFVQKLVNAYVDQKAFEEVWLTEINHNPIPKSGDITEEEALLLNATRAVSKLHKLYQGKLDSHGNLSKLPLRKLMTDIFDNLPPVLDRKKAFLIEDKALSGPYLKLEPDGHEGSSSSSGSASSSSYTEQDVQLAGIGDTDELHTTHYEL